MIGVIGGNGVAATNKLLSLVEERITCRGAFRDSHHPEMVIWQATNAPSRSMYLEGRGPSWIDDYVTIGRKLKACGCDEICMCCNTAHYAIKQLSELVGVKFIDLLYLVVLRCRTIGAKKVGLMCSDGLRKVGLYDEYFSKFAPSIELIYPSHDIQLKVTEGICNSKSSIRFNTLVNTPDHPYNCFSLAEKHLRDELNADCVVAGCTDICNVYRSFAVDSYVDSLSVLADYIVSSNKNFP